MRTHVYVTNRSLFYNSACTTFCDITETYITALQQHPSFYGALNCTRLLYQTINKFLEVQIRSSFRQAITLKDEFLEVQIRFTYPFYRHNIVSYLWYSIQKFPEMQPAEKVRVISGRQKLRTRRLPLLQTIIFLDV